jgi:hypothetical protein
MPLDGGCHQLAVIGQGTDGRLFILSHQTTVTFNIRTKNSSEFAFHTQYSIGLMLRDQYHRGKGCQGRHDSIKRRMNCVQAGRNSRATEVRLEQLNLAIQQNSQELAT